MGRGASNAVFTCPVYHDAVRRRSVLIVAAASPLALIVPGLPARAAIVDDSWVDTRRDRQLPLRVRWPDGDAPCALVVYSHGLGGNRNGADVWGEAWREAGFAVVHIQHPGSDTEVLRSGMAALRRAASAEQLRERVVDVQFVVDEIERRTRAQQPGWGRVRADALGMSGHSFGAHTVQALAGQRYPVPASGAADPRFKAFIAFSPSPGQRVDAFANVTRPFLAITGANDGDPLRHAITGADRARVYDGLPPGRRALLWLAGADHMTFAGNGEQRLRARFGPLKRERGAAEAEPRHHQLVAAVSTLWWRAQLLGDAAASAALRAASGLGEGDRWRQD
jgi:predicted dienelactone hydrolase